MKKFNEFINESSLIKKSINLNDDEKIYLWNKIEYKKKKNATEKQNDLFNILKGDKNTFDEQEIDLILKSLQYTFRKKLSGLENPINNEVFKSIQEKIPSDWIIVK
jgi:hypothetical protein